MYLNRIVTNLKRVRCIKVTSRRRVNPLIANSAPDSRKVGRSSSCMYLSASSVRFWSSADRIVHINAVAVRLLAI